jgi:glycosyltransferase involved in cell wall biosynthesis
VHYGYQELEEKHRPRLTRSVLGIEERSFVVGTIARLVPQKDIPTLLNSFKIFNESSPNSTLVIIGDGPIKDEMKKLAITLGINERILWVGRTEDVDGYLSLMDTFILTSKYEGFGLVLLEALNMHLPIIAANNSAIPEVLGTDFTGLVKTGDAKAFAEKLKSLINIDVRLANISMGQKRLQLFKASKMNEEMDAVYKV